MADKTQYKITYMRIGITGSNGFLGSHIKKKALKIGFEIEEISFREKVNTNLLLIFKNNLNKINSCDYVINCCAAKNPKVKYDAFINSKLPKLIQNYIIRKKIKCRLIHISTMNIFFDFLDDAYTSQKKKAEIYLTKDKTLIVRPGLIWDQKGNGESTIFKKFLKIPLPLYFMIKPGNIYRPIDPNQLSDLIINMIKKPKFINEINVLGDKVLSLFTLFEKMAFKTKKKVLPINSVFLFWIRFFTIKKNGPIYALTQQIARFDRTGDKLKIKNKVFLKFEI